MNELDEMMCDFDDKQMKIWEAGLIEMDEKLFESGLDDDDINDKIIEAGIKEMHEDIIESGKIALFDEIMMAGENILNKQN